MATIAPSANAPEQGRSLASLNGFRVLLVEDSWIVAQSLKAILEVIGATVVGPAVTLEDAVELAEGELFDAALMDLDLQGKMASGLIAEMHQRGMPVIIMSAFDVSQQLAGYAVAVLPKPVRAETLLTKLRQVRTGIPPCELEAYC
jgi:CheY-like chemotaxis protein